MTGQAGPAFINVPADAIVLIVHFPLFMAGHAGKDGIIARIGMAVAALVPLPLMFTAVYGEVLSVVIKG